MKGNYKRSHWKSDKEGVIAINSGNGHHFLSLMIPIKNYWILDNE